VNGCRRSSANPPQRPVPLPDLKAPGKLAERICRDQI
jgi:hypothetical protein